jgi:hypothetical protein
MPKSVITAAICLFVVFMAPLAFSDSDSPTRAAIPSLFFLAMFHTDSIITVAGLPRMSFQAGLPNVAAYFTIVRLLGPCSVYAVYKKHQQDGKGSHDDLLSLCWDGEHYFVGLQHPGLSCAAAVSVVEAIGTMMNVSISIRH